MIIALADLLIIQRDLERAGEFRPLPVLCIEIGAWNKVDPCELERVYLKFVVEHMKNRLQENPLSTTNQGTIGARDNFPACVPLQRSINTRR